MTGTILHYGKRSTTGTAATSATYSNRSDCAATVESLHLTHGLVAIANGPDYCLCGHTWPCDRRTEEAAQ
jgi:hypothetical protein